MKMKRVIFTALILHWAGDDEINYEIVFSMKHAPDARSIAQPADLQSSALPMCYSCQSTETVNEMNDLSGIVRLY